jgi:hypothetical protein
MCGRYRLARKKEILAKTFDIDNNDVERSPRYNVAPGQNVPVIRQDAVRPLRSISLARWGLIPFWTLLANSLCGLINRIRPRRSRPQRNAKTLIMLAAPAEIWQPRKLLQATRHALRYCIVGFLVKLLDEIKLLLGSRHVPECLIHTA